VTGESPELREPLRARVEALPPEEFWALWWALRYLCFFRRGVRGDG
jgi:hypothetical protein